MNFETILVIGICFVAIAIVAYYFYSKYISQQNDMNALSKRFETIEMMFTIPPPQKELSDIYNRKYSTEFTNPSSNQQQGTAPPSPPQVLASRSQRLNAEAWTQPLPYGRGPSGPQRSMPRPLVPSKISCEIGLCDLQPLQLETNDPMELPLHATLRDIDDDEIIQLSENKKNDEKN